MVRPSTAGKILLITMRVKYSSWPVQNIYWSRRYIRIPVYKFVHTYHISISKKMFPFYWVIMIMEQCSWPFVRKFNTRFISIFSLFMWIYIDILFFIFKIWNVHERMGKRLLERAVVSHDKCQRYFFSAEFSTEKQKEADYCQNNL